VVFLDYVWFWYVFLWILFSFLVYLRVCFVCCVYFIDFLGEFGVELLLFLLFIQVSIHVYVCYFNFLWFKINLLVCFFNFY